MTQLDIFGNEIPVAEPAAPPRADRGEQGRLFDDWAARGWTQLELAEETDRSSC